jgi:hypothetical protein
LYSLVNTIYTLHTFLHLFKTYFKKLFKIMLLLHSSGLYILIWNSKNRHSIQNLIKYIFSYRQEQDKEVKMYREVYNRHKDFLQACVGDEFRSPNI